MILLIGKSGSGKTTIQEILHNKYKFNKVVSYTTRERRANEIDGVDYHFITKNEFEEKAFKSFFAESQVFNGNYYGIAKNEISDNTLAIVAVDGFRQLKKNKDLNIVSFYISTSEENRIKFMKLRGDSEKNILDRVEYDKRVFDDVKYECDYIIENDDNIQNTVNKILSILKNDLGE